MSDAFRRMRSGCQPLRHSSPIVGFWVQRIGDIVKSPETQMLQPMHSRMSSGRPSSIFLGRNGSAIDGRAQPMRSTRPFLTTDTIRSGDVYLPTATTGFVVSFFTPSMKDSCVPSGPKREVTESFSQPASTRSHRSGSSARSPIASSASDFSSPSAPRSSSMDMRHGTAQVSPTASRVSIRVSLSRRTRFSSDPPYSSVRWLYRRERK